MRKPVFGDVQPGKTPTGLLKVVTLGNMDIATVGIILSTTAVNNQGPDQTACICLCCSQMA